MGIAVFDDYGISWDERVQREYGRQVFRHLAEGDRELFQNRHRYYGPVFELLLYSLEEAFGLEDSRDVYLMRHLVTFIAFWIGAVFFLLLCKHIFSGWPIALLGCALLILSPRIFAHAFYNSKDIPFMTMFIIGIFTLIRYLEHKTVARAALHGIACALLIDIRIVGVLLPALTLVLASYDGLMLWRGASPAGHTPDRPVGRAGGGTIRRPAWSMTAYLICLIGLTVLLWPTLWHDPVRSFIRIFAGMRNFPWEATVFYLGEYVWSTRLPWHYIPVWIGISIPLTVIGLFFVGVLASGRVLVRRRGGALAGDGRISTGRIAFLTLAWCFLPVGYSIVSRAVLYDAWRHAFFVYPGIVVVALIGLVSLLARVHPAWARYLVAGAGEAPAAGCDHGSAAEGPGRATVESGPRAGRLRSILFGAFVVLIAFDLVSVATFMIRSHPHQNVYFNRLTGGPAGAQKRFELDYWGLSYRQGLESILADDRRERILVNAATAPGRYNADILPPEARERLVFVTQPHKAEYYLTHFRWQQADRLPGREFYSVRIGGATIMAVRRLK